MSQSDLHSQVLHPGKQIGTSAVCLNMCVCVCVVFYVFGEGNKHL